jgi:uncharacterized membrane protein
MIRDFTQKSPLAAAGGVVGFGLGGLIDVLLFHLVLGEHHLISGVVDPTTRAGLRLNLLADGLFCLLMLGIMSVGFGLLWRAAPRPDVPWSAHRFAAAAVVGAGAFNLYDGVIDHYVLGLHHTTFPALDVYDLVWVAGSLFLIAAGALALRAERRARSALDAETQ